MNKINVSSYAKINLSLDVLGLTDDGFHKVSMVMQQIRLHDDVIVSFEESNSGITEIELSTNKEGLPTDEKNIAYRAARLMALRYGGGENQKSRCGKISIHIEKRIPVAAGLAGGSGNAAAVIQGLNHLWDLNLSTAEMCVIGSELGSDVPFCIMGQQGSAALAEGTGTEIKPIKGLDVYIVLVKPQFGVSTKEVYQGVDEEIAIAEAGGTLKHPDNAALVRALSEKNDAVISENMINLLELYTLKAYPQVKEIKDIIKAPTDAFKVMMSGSGPTVYAVYKTREAAQEAYQKVKGLSDEVYMTHTTTH